MGNAICRVIPGAGKLMDYIASWFSEGKPKGTKQLKADQKLDPLHLTELITKAREEMGFKTTELNVAIVGPSGVGKSSFINGIRYIQDDTEGAAPLSHDVQGHDKEGEIREEEGGKERGKEAMGPQRYQHPIFRKVILWELPAVGWEEDGADYYLKMKLYAYDFVFILSAKRFNKSGFQIAKQAIRHNKRFALVRTMADVAVQDTCKAKPEVSPLEASQSLRKAVDESLQEWLELLKLHHLRGLFSLYIISNKAFIDEDDDNVGDEKKVNAYHDETGALNYMDEEKVYDVLAKSVKLHRISSISRRPSERQLNP